MSAADPLDHLIGLLSRLPGVGTKTATRLAFFLITAPEDYPRALADALTRVAEQIRPCAQCGNFTDRERCRICEDPRRDPTKICVVSRVQDLLALERAGGYRGQYHVLHGLLSPLDGVGPEDLRIDELLRRITSAAQPVREVILAISPSVEGETTLLYLSRELAALTEGVDAWGTESDSGTDAVTRPVPLRVTRIAAGVPIGGELEYTDQVTLGRALAERREV
jgi:recombination protein RecR